MAGHIDWVFLDVGGPISSDEPYRRAVGTALREPGGCFTDGEDEAECDACRRADAAVRSMAELVEALERLGP